jgi:peptide/nickel transport system ATP-binding protein
MNDFTVSVQITAHQRRLVSLREFHLRRDRITLLLGESGIGKSLVARSLYGLLDPDDFGILINGVDYRTYVSDTASTRMRERGFFVFQEPSSHLNPLMTVQDQLHEGSLARWPDTAGSLRQLWDEDSWNDVRELLGIYPKPYRPSGGEKQRILLAMALSKIDMLRATHTGTEGGIFIFDEPTGSLDNRYRNLFLARLLKRFRERPFTVLFITHDYSLINHIASEHHDLMPRVDFRELARSEDGLVFRDFEPATYSTWQASLSRSPAARLSASSLPLLTVESALTIFGRSMEITADPDGRTPLALKVQPGRLTYLKAPSGTGKTTVAKALMGLLPGGNMRVNIGGARFEGSTPRKEWREKIWGKVMTMVFQHADEALNMHSTVEETLRQLPGRAGTSGSSVRENLGELFEGESVRALMRKKVWMLSGGQKQKLNLLRGLMLQTGILILDEPLNGLDFESCAHVVAMMKRRLQEGMGILTISHNEEIFDALTEEADRYYLHVRPTWAHH